ncbi:MAG: hypothetical protein RMN51_10720 [Verrucomicrobiota bacterium]|nr:hypothetical protein [Limisphaera sp.]MDW8382560.1 hypothetical protein [Verrucomicrobiota bacterium]
MSRKWESHRQALMRAARKRGVSEQPPDGFEHRVLTRLRQLDVPVAPVWTWWDGLMRGAWVSLGLSLVVAGVVWIGDPNGTMLLHEPDLESVLLAGLEEAELYASEWHP